MTTILRKMKILKSIWQRRLVWSNFPMNYCVLKIKNVNYKSYPQISGKLILIGSGRLILGNKVSINSGLRSNPIGGDTRTIISIGDNALITIGDKTGLSNCSIICKEKIIIGENVNIGGSVKIYDTDFHNLNAKNRLVESTDIPNNSEIIIGDNCFIGAHSIILKGVKIGENSIIGAGSLISKSIPENQIWAGNPAKFIRNI